MLEELETRLAPAVLTVVSDQDAGQGTLRWAIGMAGGGDTINFDTTVMQGATITLKTPLALNADLTIDGTTANVTISGNNSTQLFQISNQSSDTINNLAFTNGYVANANGGAIVVNSGSTLDLNNDAFSNNIAKVTTENVVNGGGSPDAQQALGCGGAIENKGNLTITACTFSSNSASDSGGAIDSNGNVAYQLQITSSYFDSNKGAIGGAINTANPTTLTSDSFGADSGNSATQQGGAVNATGGSNSQAALNVTNSKFYGNQATRNVSSGGAIYTAATTTLSGDVFGGTVKGNANTANYNGGAVYAKPSIPTMKLTVKNSTTFTANQAGTDGGGIWSGDITIVSNSTFASNVATNTGGGIAYEFSSSTSSSSLQVNLDSFSNNTAGRQGGGMYCYISLSGTNSAAATSFITNSTFFQNAVNTNENGSGGGLYDIQSDGTMESNSFTLVNDTFFQNTCNLAGGFGGGISSSLFGQGTLTFSMTSLTVTGNTAVSDAGGVYISNSNGQVSVDNNIFDGNSVTQNGFNGPIDFYVSNVNQQSFNDIGYNLVGISDNMFTQDSNDILNNTTGLANALALNGAPAGNPLTLALSKNNSPGYDTGDQSLASQANPNSIDERGLTRQAKGVAGQEVSIGAYDPDAK